MSHSDDIYAVYRRQGRTPLEDIHHTHDEDYEILQTYGHGSVLIGNEIYQMSDGRVFFISPLCVHMTNPSGQFTDDSHNDISSYVRNVVKIHRDTLHSLLDSANGGQILALLDRQASFCLPQSAESAAVIDLRIKSIADAVGKYAEIHRSVGVLELLLELFEDYSAAPIQSNHSISEKVLEYIKQNYRYRITLDMISEAVNVSKYHLCRIFRQDTRMTITEYIIQYRLAEVKKRLITGSDPIADIAADAGFDTYTYFSALFRRREGVSPSEYRQQKQNRG